MARESTSGRKIPVFFYYCDKSSKIYQQIVDLYQQEVPSNLILQLNQLNDKYNLHQVLVNTDPLSVFARQTFKPFMTLVVSDMKAKHLLKSKPLLLSEH